MIAIIVLLSMILFVLVYISLFLKNVLEFIANRLMDVNANLKSILNALEKPTKSK